MTKTWVMSEEDREMTRRICEKIEALEKKRGRPFEPNCPVFLAILSSPPDSPLMSPLPDLDD